VWDSLAQAPAAAVKVHAVHGGAAHPGQTSTVLIAAAIGIETLEDAHVLGLAVAVSAVHLPVAVVVDPVRAQALLAVGFADRAARQVLARPGGAAISGKTEVLTCLVAPTLRLQVKTGRVVGAFGIIAVDLACIRWCSRGRESNSKTQRTSSSNQVLRKGLAPLKLATHHHHCCRFLHSKAKKNETDEAKTRENSRCCQAVQS
jgi:hypothetical protein